jgi:hypothetical protein
MKNLLEIAFYVGFIGDALLQIFTKMGLGGQTGAGLNGYFLNHGSIESLFIAGGMMVLFYSLFMLTKLPMNYLNIAIYGVLLDLVFRIFMIFPSLKGYYSYLNYFWSGFWQVFSMLLPLLIYNNVV